MALLFGSDFHFYHKKILEYTARPFSTVEEMNEGLIANWNSQAKPEDEIIVDGDFSFADPTITAWILDRLNGTKYLVKGNHDESSITEPALSKWAWVKDYHEFWYHDKRSGGGKWFFVFSHYPFLTWNKSHYGSINCFGHQHGTEMVLDPGKRQFDVGVDANQCGLVPIEKIIDAASKIKVINTKHKAKS